MSATYLLAMDGSDTAQRALKYAVEILSPDRAEIIVASVAEEIPSYMLGEEMGIGIDPATLRANLVNAVENVAEDAVGRLEERGFTVKKRVLQGDAGTALVELARDQEVDGIVMGRRRQGRARELLLGSVSHHVIHHAPCPVVVVPGEA